MIDQLTDECERLVMRDLGVAVEVAERLKAGEKVEDFDGEQVAAAVDPAADTLNFYFADSYKTFVKPQASNAAAWAKRLRQGCGNPALSVMMSISA